jgi:hypothetical protein
MYKWCSRMLTTYAVHMMVSLFHRKLISGWDQFVNIEKLIKAKRSLTIHMTSIPLDRYRAVHSTCNVWQLVLFTVNYRTQRPHMASAQITEIQLCIQNTYTYNWILVATVKVTLKSAGTQLSYQPWSKTYFHFVKTMTPLFNRSTGMFMQSVIK